ncbi:MAG TPA: MOSC N-terminal beta barrel domain-containing protein [Nocardioidaceae bacterium]|nr:MOSC N-terminal beta barrel domain-containing protein [Nocardioidaceae bacterium]
MITVSRLQVSPVKGLALVPRHEVRLDTDGVAEDRRVFLLRANATVATIRRFPTLLGVTPDLDLDAGALTVTFPDGHTVTSDLAAVGQDASARLFGKDRHGRVLPGAVADALSDYVGEPLRVVLADRTGVGWDEGPVSLIGQASVAAVETPQVPDGSGSARYRMLIEVGGTEPYEEDSWVDRDVRLGEAQLTITQALERCVVITYSPRDGGKDWAGLQALADHGRGQLTLGVIASVGAPGMVRVGDPVEVGSRRP